MKQLRGDWGWSTTIALLVFGLSLALVVTSCGRAASPVSPGVGGGTTFGEVPEPTPTPSETPTPEPTPTPSPTPSPTPTPSTCSPGFWKNHTELWVPNYCAAYPWGGTCSAILADLTAQGPGSSVLRARAAGYLNGLGIATCTDVIQ